MARRVATFHDNVRVVKTNPRPEKGTGPICAQHPPGRSGKLDLSPFPAPDQIACDLLSLWFIERASGAGGSPSAKTATTAGSLDLAPERLEAVGNPVVVTAPSSNATAQAKRIEYNLLAKSITLDGDNPVFLQQGPNQICRPAACTTSRRPKKDAWGNSSRKAPAGSAADRPSGPTSNWRPSGANNYGFSPAINTRKSRSAAAWN